MAQQIDIPGVGIVEFPDGMSDSDIASAIKNNIMPKAPTDNPLKQFGRSAAGLADTAINSVNSMIPQVAYPVARAFGGSPESATKTAESMTPQQNPVGKFFGVEQTPEYKGEASQRLMSFIGENVSKGSDWISKQTGVPKQDVENMLNTMGIAAGAKAAPYANKAIGVAGNAAENAVVGTGKAVAQGAKNVAAAPADIARGVTNAIKSPNTPVATRVIPETAMTEMKNSGDIGPFKEAFIRANNKEAPIHDRRMEAAAESAARGYTNIGKDTKSTIFGGLQGAADLASIIGTGLPLPLGSMTKGAISGIGSALSPFLASEGGASGILNFGSKNPKVGNYSTHPIHDIMMTARETLGTHATPELVTELTISNRAKQLMTEAKNKNIEMPKEMAIQIAQQEYRDFRKPSKSEPQAEAPLMLTNNPTPKPMYATEGGMVGNDMNAVQQAELAKKYAPQKADVPEPVVTPVPQAPVAPAAPKKQPVVETPVAPAFKPSPELGKSPMAEMLAKMRESGETTIESNKAPGKREMNAANKEMKEQNLSRTISEWSNMDSDVRNIDTQPVDITDMDNATRGMYNMLKKMGGAYDEIPSMEWLRVHGISEQTFIRRLVGGSRPRK